LFVSGYKGSVKLTGSGLAMIQQRVQSYKWLPLSKTSVSEEFVKYIQQKFPNFDSEGFYGVR
jgi:hypothetical protein